MADVFQRLDSKIQRWVYKQGWADLRDIQKEAIEPVLSGGSDLVISASTAAGKTEAAFLPACSAIAGETDGFGILYLSPLKALINDQYRRLESLCDVLDMKVTPWHGDSSQSKKRDARRYPEGILLITPESLESRLVLDPGWARASFGSLKYIIIDEYHCFVGTERGTHLQSLMHRLEHLLGRQRSPIPRIALSATLGDMDGVMGSLRPNSDFPSLLIKDDSKMGLKLQVRGYISRVSDESEDEDSEDLSGMRLSADVQVARDLYKVLRGDSHLVFANRRRDTEKFAAMLSDLCSENSVPNEFFPHHGSLSKELREELESRLQKGALPTTAVCTMTLELGIDIGKIKSVAQVTAPNSVSSLRQRLGRSGRRGDPAMLSMFIKERYLAEALSIVDKLRLELLQSIAIIHLLSKEKWYEPPDRSLFHFSTLLHQVLAVIAQWGGVRAEQLWSVLCESGTFANVAEEQFRMLLRGMGEKDLIRQISGGELVLGEEGEKIVDHYGFYAVFKTPQEYRIIIEEEGKTLGTLPIDSFVLPEQHIIFAGRRWEVKDVDIQKRVVYVTPTKGGNPPRFGGDGMFVHNRIRQEMLRIYLQGDYHIDSGAEKPEFMDAAASSLFSEGLRFFRDMRLEDKRIISRGKDACLIPWMGDKIVNTLSVLLIMGGYKSDKFAGVVEIEGAGSSDVSRHLKSFSKDNRPTNAELAKLVENKQTEKYDHLLPEELLNEDYGARAFDIDGTINWITEATEQGYL